MTGTTPPRLFATCAVARITIEFTSPFLVGSGHGDSLTDRVPVSDADGLPVIPGASLAGVLRSAMRAAGHDTNSLFGHADDAGGASTGSRLWVSWAHVHDAADRPTDGVRPDGPADDDVLRNARTLSVRDHVRIGPRGSAAEGGKFDQAVVPAGHRFTFEIRIEDPCGLDSEDGELASVLDVLRSGHLRIGSGGTRGLGSFRVIRAAARCFRLSDRKDCDEFLSLPARLDETASALRTTRASGGAEDADWTRIEFDLVPTDWFAVHGAAPWTTPAEGPDAKAPDQNPVRETRVVWGDRGGRVTEPELYIPGTSIKGALAHRVAFHHNRLCCRFADKPSDAAPPVGESSPAVRELFGAMKGGPGEARRGRVHVDDVVLGPDVPSERLTHVAIDRFTGGALHGKLYEERVLAAPPRPMRVRVLVRGLGEIPDVGILEALRAALADLAEERLALGAGASRGHGYFRALDAAAARRAIDALAVPGGTS